MSTIDYETAVQRLAALGDEELDAFARALDDALRRSHSGPHDDELGEIASIAAAARHMHRQRQAAAAGERAKDIVRQLLSTPENE